MLHGKLCAASQLFRWGALLGTVLTPDLIGQAARSGHYDDPQSLKRVWHYLARFGRQADDTPTAAWD
ncbi:hypothetical protein [Rhodococcus globerulus]|uniref:hypothetical protein n=1 Tax=Rhodococcus globerulus TaxID=33008 RepID=UPI00294B7736|nr:hypothetical protein [Rhodococcus globerulus]